MFWQREALRSSIAMTFNQTYELELPRSGSLGSLVLYARSTQNAQPFLTAVKWRLIDYISKIEIIGDGSEIIKSYDGRQAIASAFHDDRVIPPSMWRHYSNTPHRQWIPIHFGRKLFDELRGLDLSRFNQVLLRITNDATATEFTTNIQLDVHAYWKREGGGFQMGYYREEEWKTWAPVANAWEYSTLPSGLPIRRILLRGRPGVDSADSKNNSSMHRLMDDIEFTFRTGQTRVYRGSLEDLGHLSILELGGYPETMAMIDRTDEYGFEVGIGYVIGGVKATGTYTDAPGAYPNTIAAADVQDSKQEIKNRTGDAPIEGIFRGHGFMHNVAILESMKADDSDLLDVEGLKDVDLDIHCQSGTTVSGTDAAAENAIVLSRLVR